MNPTIEEPTGPVEQEARKRPESQRFVAQPGMGPITALAFVLINRTPERFSCGKQIGSYVRLIPAEDSSAGKQRLGPISKQVSSLLRFLLVEAAQAAAHCDADWRRRYVHLVMRRQRNIAKVAMARRLAVRLYWMWRNSWEYSRRPRGCVAARRQVRVHNRTEGALEPPQSSPAKRHRKQGSATCFLFCPAK